MRRRALVVCLVAACAAPRGSRTVPPSPSSAAASASLPAVVVSNVERRDYAGSQACAGCHADIYDRFMGTPMHNMTRLPTATTPMPPFAGRFRFKDDAVAFDGHGDERLMTIESQGRARTFRVTKVIGGHYREDFAGVEVGGGDGQEHILPASWFLGTQKWRYKGYSVLGPERPQLRPGGVWARTCIFCHNTEPLLDTMLGPLSGYRLGPYQGEVVDPILPAERRARYQVTDRAGLERAVAAELTTLHAPARSGADAGDLLKATRARFGAANLVELGIGCESCHGGSREHVQHNAVKPSFTPRAPWLDVKYPDAGRATAVNRVCARCHQVLFTRYPWTWEGGRRDAAVPGGSNINSGEARDFLLGGCASAMACSDCHDAHAHNQPLEPALEARADAVCTRCHPALATAEAQRAHTHHDPAGAGGRCLNCHMPRKNLSLDNRLTRYHRVGSPDAPAKVEGDRPLECALCHADRSVGALVDDMERWWHRRYDRDKLRALYGDDWAQASPLLETIARGKPHEQAVALALAGQAQLRAAVPLAAVQLTHPIPIVRYYAQSALEALLGAPAPFDVHANNDAIVTAARSWLASFGIDARLTAPARPNATSGGDIDP